MTDKPTESLVGFAIPDGVAFADLKLARHLPTGDVSFDWAPIEKICEANGLDVAVLRESHEDNVGAFLAAWYDSHRAAGGPIDLVAEQLLSEVQAEEGRGQGGVQAGPGTLQ
jgi:hypothetical protein